MIRAGFLNRRLCLECYLSELEKKVKRNISALRLKGVADHVFVPLHPMFPLTSILLYRIVEKIERRFAKRPKMLVLKNWEGVRTEDMRKPYDVLFVEVDEKTASEIEEKRRRGIAWYWRFLRGIYVSYVRDYYNSILVMPGCADFLSFLDLFSFIASVERSNENLPVISYVGDREPGIINGFYGVPCGEVVAASYLALRGEVSLEVKRPLKLSKLESLTYRMLLDAIRDKSYEGLINVEKAFAFFSSLEAYKKCEFCRGASNRSLCKYCYDSGEQTASVEIEGGK